MIRINKDNEKVVELSKQKISFDRKISSTKQIENEKTEIRRFLAKNNAKYVEQKPFLIRRINNKKIVVDRIKFTLGRDQYAADEFIDGNMLVSRVHGVIIKEEGQWYAMDLRSSNGSFLNGTPMNPEEKYLIGNGDILKLADEEFEIYFE